MKKTKINWKVLIISITITFAIAIAIGHDSKKCTHSNTDSVENFEKLSDRTNMHRFCDAKGYKLGYISWSNKLHCFETTSNAEGSQTRENDFEIKDYYYWYFEQ